MNHAELADFIAALNADPRSFVTFIEAHAIRAELQTLRFVSSATASHVVQLLDHPRATAGARRVLGEAVARLAADVADQWRAGQTPIGIQQSGALVRVEAGSSVVASLPEPGMPEAYWRIEDLAGPLTITLHRHYPPAPGGAGYFRLEARADALGLARIEATLVGQAPPDKARRERSFTLYVLVDTRVPEATTTAVPLNRAGSDPLPET